jgi:hypothetical protein
MVTLVVSVGPVPALIGADLRCPGGARTAGEDEGGVAAVIESSGEGDGQKSSACGVCRVG